MRIAVTYENESGDIFQHFGHSEAFKFYDVENEKIVKSSILSTNGSGHGALADFLKANSTDMLICGGIGGGAQTALSQAGIKLYGGVNGNADLAINSFLEHRLNYSDQANCDHHANQNHGECGEHGCGHCSNH